MAFIGKVVEFLKKTYNFNATIEDSETPSLNKNEIDKLKEDEYEKGENKLSWD